MNLDPQNYSPSDTLLLIACCKQKNQDTQTICVGPSILTSLTAETQQLLANARQAHQPDAHMLGPGLLPAYRRYTGYFYQAADAALDQAIKGKRHVLIISGGYGVLVADEPIHWYEAQLRLRPWGTILQDSIAEYAHTHKLRAIMAFLPASANNYVKVAHRIAWQQAGVQHAVHVTAVVGGKQGAQRKVPTALGEAFAA